MRASRTKGSRTGGRRYLRHFRLRFFPEDALPEERSIKFKHAAGPFLPAARNAGSPDLIFQERFQLLHHEHFLHLLCEFPDQVHGQREGQPQFQERCILREHFLRIFIGHAGSDDADLLPLHFHPVQPAGIAVLRQFPEPLLYLRVVLPGIRRHTDVLPDIPVIFRRLVLCPLTEFHQTLGMVDPGRGAEQHRCVELLGDFIGGPDEILALLTVGRLHQGDLRRSGIVTVVLFVLGRMHARIVCSQNDESPRHPHIPGGEHRICRHIQTHHLHGTERPGSGNGCAVGHLHSHLLVRRPFRIDLLPVFRHILQNFRTWCPRVCGADFHAGLVDASGHRFVSGKQLFHDIPSCPISLSLGLVSFFRFVFFFSISVNDSLNNSIIHLFPGAVNRMRDTIRKINAKKQNAGGDRHQSAIPAGTFPPIPRR